MVYMTKIENVKLFAFFADFFLLFQEFKQS